MIVIRGVENRSLAIVVGGEGELAHAAAVLARNTNKQQMMPIKRFIVRR